MDNAIKQEESHGRDLSHRKPLIVIECHNLRFSQQSIKEEFRDGSSLRGLINELAANPDQAYRIPPLRIFKSGAHYVSLDNRRLACLFECSRFLRQPLKVRCMLYSPQFILTHLSKCQASKVRYYWSSAHRGAFVQVRGASARNASRVIRVFKTNARSKAPKKKHERIKRKRNKCTIHRIGQEFGFLIWSLGPWSLGPWALGPNQPTPFKMILNRLKSSQSVYAYSVPCDVLGCWWRRCENFGRTFLPKTRPNKSAESFGRKLRPQNSP